MMIMTVESTSFNTQQGEIADYMKQVGDRVRRVRKKLAHIVKPANASEKASKIAARITVPSQEAFAAAVSQYVGYEVSPGVVNRLELGANLPSNLAIYKYLNHAGYPLDYILFGREPQKTQLTPLATQQLFIDLDTESQLDLAIKSLGEISLRKEKPYDFLSDFMGQLLTKPTNNPAVLLRPDEIKPSRVDALKMGKRLRVARGILGIDDWFRLMSKFLVSESMGRAPSASTLLRRENEGLCASSLGEFEFYATLDTNLDYLVLGRKPDAYPKSKVLICDAISNLDTTAQEFLYCTVLPEILSLSDRTDYMLRLHLLLRRVVDWLN